MSHLPEKPSLTLPSTIDAGSAAADWILGLADSHGIDEELTERIVLVTAEAIANAAEHGNGVESDKSIEMTFQIDDGELVICVEDEGAGITVERIEEATLPEDPFSQDGRGLYIIREMTDRVWLEADGRRLCMAWHRR